MPLPRMRTIDETIRHLKENDPECRLTKWALREMVLSGRIPSNKVGKKRLINIERLEEYLRDDAESFQGDEKRGEVRRQVLKFG